MITAQRYHDISCGHRVHGHESKCAHLHGHNYRAHGKVHPVVALDVVGRVLDFSVVKARLCDGLPATAVALIDELAWRLQRQVDEPSTQDPFRMPKFERGPNGRFTNRVILDEAQQHDNGERNQPLLSDVRG